jgi:Ca2+-binding RTX toxin-like protein
MLRRLLALAVVPTALALPAVASAAVTTSLADGVLNVVGDTAADTIDLHVSGGTVIAAGASVPRAAVTRVSLQGGGGADTITVGDGLGGLRVEIRGGQGNDLLSGGDGDETFVWNPGDASDTIDGGAGDDALVFSGANINEQFALAPGPAPGKIRLTRDVGAVTLDLAGIERLTLSMLAGTDTFTGSDGVAALLPRADLFGGVGADTITGGDEADTIDGGADGDALAGGGGDDRFVYAVGEAADVATPDGGLGDDALWVTGSPVRDVFGVSSPGAGTVAVAETTSQTSWTAAVERAAIDALGGDDDVTNVTANVPLDLRGGEGDDVLDGAGQDDRLDGGEGDDVLDGGAAGDDTLAGGPGTDALRGGAGADRFSCGGVGDTFDATAQDTVDADCSPAPAPPAPVIVTVPGPVVTVPGPPAPVPVPAPDTRAPALTLRGLPTVIKRAALLKNGLGVRVTADERASLTGELLSTARSARIAATAPNLTLATRTLPAAAAGTRTLALKPSNKLIGSARRFTLIVRVVATDAAGNRRTATKTVKVR